MRNIPEDERCAVSACPMARRADSTFCNSHYGMVEEGRLKVCEHCGAVDGTPHEPGCLAHVDHPEHYGGADDPYEVIKVLKAWLTPEELRGFCKGNAIKYLARAGKKPGQPSKRDEAKAEWYAKYLIENC